LWAVALTVGLGKLVALLGGGLVHIKSRPRIAVPSASHTTPRIAFCTDTFDEANGVATVSRAFVEYARRHHLPFLLIRPGSQSRTFTEGALTIVEVAKSALSIPLDMGLKFDLLVWRQADWLRGQMNAFHPDIVHITGPGDIGMVCARLSHTLRVPKPPLVAAWHTNVHQYARMRAQGFLDLLPRSAGRALGAKIEDVSFLLAARFYKTGRLILAPNQDILTRLTRQTGKPGQIMLHGVDSDLFAPPQEKPPTEFVTLGYAGRLTAEKNVRFLVELANGLPADIRARVRFRIVGDGAQRSWLERHLPPSTEFMGLLRGKDLAAAYAQMDVFLFPSLSDTFGLVLLEALSCGIPVVSFQVGGPKPVVEDGVDGFTAATSSQFVDAVVRTVRDPDLRYRLSLAARQSALRKSWESVFSSVYEAYDSLKPAPVETFTKTV
jgi:phosphatidylinositol alpha 1,6-mannosyltransferase